MDNSTALGPELWEVEQFLRTPDAHRVLNRANIACGGGLRRQRLQAPTYDRVIEAALAGDEPLEVIARPLPDFGQWWMVTLKNYPHIAVFVSNSKSKCEIVAKTRTLMASD